MTTRTLDTDMMPLMEAAQQLKLGYEAARHLVLTGELHGQKRDGRWLVDAQSVARLREQEGDE